MHGYTIEDVKRIVKSNDKQRFSLEEDQDGRLKIRANQGHSIEVRVMCLYLGQGYINNNVCCIFFKTDINGSFFL